jgi:hypothetical protein
VGPGVVGEEVLSDMSSKSVVGALDVTGVDGGLSSCVCSVDSGVVSMVLGGGLTGVTGRGDLGIPGLRRGGRAFDVSMWRVVCVGGAEGGGSRIFGVNRPPRFSGDELLGAKNADRGGCVESRIRTGLKLSGVGTFFTLSN